MNEWRVGQSWGSKENPALVTIVETGTGEKDDRGRRPDDRLVGAVSPADAELICTAVNDLNSPPTFLMGFDPGRPKWWQRQKLRRHRRLPTGWTEVGHTTDPEDR